MASCGSWHAGLLAGGLAGGLAGWREDWNQTSSTLDVQRGRQISLVGKGINSQVPQFYELL